MPIAVQHDGDRGVAGHGGDVLGVGSLSDPERDGGVSEIVDAERFESGGGNRRAPDASTKERRPDRKSLRRLVEVGRSRLPSPTTAGSQRMQVTRWCRLRN
jgi:hypothetical protein